MDATATLAYNRQAVDLADLTNKERWALRLYGHNGLTPAEIGEGFDIPTDRVEFMLRRARKLYYLMAQRLGIESAKKI
jgi:DNA-directed RNA polymerase specialized sigma24 family protein